MRRLSLLTPGAVPTTFVTGQEPFGIAVDATSVYWANYASETASKPGVMRYTPK